MKRTGTVASASAVLMILAGLGGCAGRHDDASAARSGSERLAAEAVRVPGGDRPEWLDLYQSRNVVNVSTVDHVVIVKFQTLAQRDEVFGHYSDEFGREENFVSFRDNRDIISFLREGYGVKITLIDPVTNLWSLEYHRQTI